MSETFEKNMKNILHQVFDKKGSALLIAMALIAMLTGVAIMSVDRSNVDMELSYNQLHEEQSFYAAEAGAARALVELNKNFSWRGPIIDAQLDGRKYAVIVLDSLWNPALMDTVLIKATANYSGTAVNLENWVAPSYFKPFKYAAFGADSMIMKNSACTDSYNSDSGSYAATQTIDDGDIGSNGYIKLTNIATVNGDAQTSTTGGITLDNSASVGGDTTSTAPVNDMGYITDSAYTFAQTNSLAPGGFSGTYTYDPATKALTLAKNDTLKLSSGVYYLSTVNMGEQSSIQIQPGAKVQIYTTGNMTFSQNTSINPGGVPSNVQIFSKGTSLTLGQYVEFRAIFWGANTNITVSQNTSVYGSLTGKSVSIANSACVHFDRSLLKFVTKKIESMEMVAWRQN